jgi:predicted site-specific integrase-resolvase
VAELTVREEAETKVKAEVESRLAREAEARLRIERRAKEEAIAKADAETRVRMEAETKARVETAAKVREENAVVYARVSLEDQRADLIRQMAKAVRYATRHEIKVGTTVTEIGSRYLPKLMNLLRNSQIKVIMVERRNCLTGFEYIKAALSAEGRRLIAMNS